MQQMAHGMPLANQIFNLIEKKWNNPYIGFYRGPRCVPLAYRRCGVRSLVFTITIMAFPLINKRNPDFHSCQGILELKKMAKYQWPLFSIWLANSSYQPQCQGGSGKIMRPWQQIDSVFKKLLYFSEPWCLLFFQMPLHDSLARFSLFPEMPLVIICFYLKCH